MKHWIKLTVLLYILSFSLGIRNIIISDNNVLTVIQIIFLIIIIQIIMALMKKFKSIKKKDNLLPVINKIKKLSICTSWKKDGIALPNALCKDKTLKLIKYIYNSFSVLPDIIQTTIEEGIFIQYRNKNNNKKLEIEIYNDLDIAAIITRNRKTIKVYNIYDMKVDHIIKLFLK